MYNNLIIEMKKRKITQTAIALIIKRTNNGVKHKITGDTDFTSSEMFLIKDAFFPDMTLEYLFQKN